MTDRATRLIALDWGTTSLRAALLSADGAVLDRAASAEGIMAGSDFAATFARITAPWRRPGVVALASGMIGSRQGWLEAPYAACPAGLDELAAGLVWTEASGIRLGFVPGLHWQQRDVMRGEEVQIAGALARTGLPDGLFVLPGTHSKWAEVQAGRIVRFRTFMTGELFAALRGHTILGRLMAPGDPPFDPTAFAAGCARAGQGSVLHALFSARTEGLFGRLGPQALVSYLSGLLVGEEVREAAGEATQVTLVCSPSLAAPYAAALAARGVRTDVLDAEAAFTGLHAVARAAGLLEGPPA